MTGNKKMHKTQGPSLATPICATPLYDLPSASKPRILQFNVLNLCFMLYNVVIVEMCCAFGCLMYGVV